MATIQECKNTQGKIRYRVQIRMKGHAPVSHYFDRKTDAKMWAQMTETDMREGRYFKTAEAKKHTVGELVDRYITTVLPQKPKSEKKQKAQLLWWKAQIGHIILANLTPSLIAELRDKLLSETTCRGTKRSPSTVVRYMAAFSHACTIATKEWGWLDDSPVRKVSKPKESRGRVRFLDDTERHNLLEECKNSRNPWLYTIVVLAISTGTRLSELMNLTWKDVDLKKGKIILQQTKNGEIRSITITGHALELLRKHETTRRVDSKLLFPGKNPNKPADFRGAWNYAVKRSKVEDFRYHDLRHTTGSYLAMNNASPSELAEILGHKTLQMVKRYAHLSDSHTANVVSKMNDKIFKIV